MGKSIIYLLGPVQFDWNAGEPRRFRSKRTKALLGYLAAKRRPVTRDALAALLWPDETRSTGKANLRRELHNLGNILPDCWETDRQTVRFLPGRHIRVDIYDVLRLEKNEKWVEAAELVRGDFLEGIYLDDNLEFETWLLGERERWRQRAERVLSKAVKAQQESGDEVEALRLARRLLQLVPWHEETHRTVMRLLALNGQRSSALKQFERCREVLKDELGVAVSAETRALYERICDPLTFARHNIPAPTTPLIGREEELDLLSRWLADDDVRLVTITGPGGIGKTSLALEVARNAARSFADGAAFVSLAPLSDAEAIVPAVAQALRFDFYSGDHDSQRQLLDYLRGKEMLLMLDNFEHLLEAAPLLTEVVRTAPGVRLLTTSRERLKLQVEKAYPLQGLAFSHWETVAQAQDDPAVQLFLYHAQRVRPSFTLREEHLESLQEILRLLNGVPLAVILAAGWVEILNPAEIAAEITSSLDVLESMKRDVPERHRSMRAVFESTWARLGGRERTYFAALSAFRGGFTLEAARTVAGASPKDLLRLVERSLLSRVKRGRFEAHELLRQFAAEQLSSTLQKEEVVRRRHSRYYCEFLQKREEDLKGSRSQEAESEITVELDNVRTAWTWAVENAVELVYQAQTAFLLYFERQGRRKEAETTILQAKARLEEWDKVDARRMAELLAWGGRFVQLRSTKAAEELLRQASDCLTKAATRGEDVRAEKAFILHTRGLMARTENESDSVALLRQSLSLYQELGSHWEMAWVQHSLGQSYARQAKYPRAHEHFRRSIQLQQIVEEKKMVQWPRMALAMSMASMGRLDEAEESVLRALAYGKATGDERTTALALNCLGDVLILSGRFEEALRALESSRARWANLGRDEAVRVCRSDRCRAALHLGRYDEVRHTLGHILVSDLESGEPAVFLQAEVSYLQGSAALALGSLDEARAYLQDGLRSYRAIKLRNAVAITQAVLGCVAIHVADRAMAQKYVAEAMDPGLFVPNLLALPVMALLRAELGDAARAVELYALASRHDIVANSQWFEDVAGRRIAAAAHALPPERVAAARARGAARDLWQTRDELLQELKRMDF